MEWTLVRSEILAPATLACGRKQLSVARQAICRQKGKRSSNAKSVKDRQGGLLTKEEAILGIWIKDFEDLLNLDEETPIDAQTMCFGEENIIALRPPLPNLELLKLLPSHCLSERKKWVSQRERDGKSSGNHSIVAMIRERIDVGSPRVQYYSLYPVDPSSFNTCSKRIGGSPFPIAKLLDGLFERE
ncbi:unnamed protein product [Clavelina lepadiformis]|uniref:Uncharacterized protein n=1 Tax=Clavelina lepadiformis TaxID=159417 RepID=A0ABP0H521_CLALP